MLTCTTGERSYSSSSPACATIPTVFVVDDDGYVRESLATLIQSSAMAAETFASAQTFLGRPRPSGPHCLILDINVPDVSGLALLRRLAAERPDMPVIVVTGNRDVAMCVQAMKAGAIEYLAKPLDEATMVSAIQHALERSRRTLRRHAQLRALWESYESLTPREREVMVLVVSGLLNKQVGGELGISEITVKAHRGQVMRKMKAESLPALVNMVADLGLVTATAAAL